jgi:hypothetical protein
MTSNDNHVIRISKLTNLNQVYWDRVYYSKLKRKWTPGSKLVFIAKTVNSNDAFMGLGNIQIAYHILDLNVAERDICTENNYHSKVVFDSMVRFYPAVLVKEVRLSSTGNTYGPSLDGAQISDSDISDIEERANIVVTT